MEPFNILKHQQVDCFDNCNFSKHKLMPSLMMAWL